MTHTWPPPPDLDSLKELLQNADIEGLIQTQGAPPDEYDTEAEELHEAIAPLPTAQILASTLTPILETIWRKNFNAGDAELAARGPELRALAAEIARFFGPEATPQTRDQPR